MYVHLLFISLDLYFYVCLWPLCNSRPANVNIWEFHFTLGHLHRISFYTWTFTQESVTYCDDKNK